MPAEVGIELTEWFSDPDQQRDAAKLGMWIFLATELLMFSGLFVSALIIRVLHPASVTDATLHFKYWIGCTNTFILLCGGLAMHIAVVLARHGRQRAMVVCFLLTAFSGAAYVLLTGYEYLQDWSDHMMPFLPNYRYALVGDPASRLFVDLYFITTGLHILHVTITIFILLVMAWMGSQEWYLKTRWYRTEVMNLFWQFIVFLWIIIFTAFYLLNR